MLCFKRKFSTKSIKIKSKFVLYGRFTPLTRLIIQIFYWTLVAWQKMQKERFEGKKEICAAKYMQLHKMPSPT